jgi:hypothetical protein
MACVEDDIYSSARKELLSILQDQKKDGVVVPRRLLRLLAQPAVSGGLPVRRAHGRIPADEVRPMCHGKRMFMLRKKGAWQCPVCLRLEYF